MHDTSEALPGLLVCPETLQPLRSRPDGLWSEAAKRLYPTHGGLVYMGYPKRDQAMISSTMQEERAWQGTVATLERDAAFLRESAPTAVKFINMVDRHIDTPHPRTVELGSGSGWVSWLLASAGHEVYLCDFEANSLTLGQVFTHPNIRPGSRVVTDARYAPFPDGTFDVVFIKEFVHHVSDFQALFREANRLLHADGILAFLEPTMSVVKWIYERRHPDPHVGHHIRWPGQYLRSLEHSGFEPVHITALFDRESPRNPVLRVFTEKAVDRTRRRGRLDAVGVTQLTLFGRADFGVIAKQTRSVAQPPRPEMSVIDPTTMTTTTEDCELYGQLVGIVEEAASALVPLPSQGPTRSGSQGGWRTN
jgi:SAM-dependent methyltransferase